MSTDERVAPGWGGALGVEGGLRGENRKPFQSALFSEPCPNIPQKCVSTLFNSKKVVKLIAP